MPEPDDTHDHLYVDERGQIRDGHIEHLFKDIADSDEYDSVTRHNLPFLVRALLGERAPPDELSLAVFDDIDAVCDYATRISFVTLWQLDQEDLAALPANVRKRAKYGCKLGNTQRGEYVTADTPHRAILLAIVQYVREMAQLYNNPAGGIKH